MTKNESNNAINIFFIFFFARIAREWYSRSNYNSTIFSKINAKIINQEFREFEMILNG